MGTVIAMVTDTNAPPLSHLDERSGKVGLSEFSYIERHSALALNTASFILVATAFLLNVCIVIADRFILMRNSTSPGSYLANILFIIAGGFILTAFVVALFAVFPSTRSVFLADKGEYVELYQAKTALASNVNTITESLSGSGLESDNNYLLDQARVSLRYLRWRLRLIQVSILFMWIAQPSPHFSSQVFCNLGVNLD
jgi:hypothetical protein